MQPSGANAGRAAHDEIGTAGQRSADRLVRLAAHEHGLAERERFEAAQIRRQPPRQLIAAPDDIVLRHRNDQFHAALYAGGAKLASVEALPERAAAAHSRFAIAGGFTSSGSSAKASTVPRPLVEQRARASTAPLFGLWASRS